MAATAPFGGGSTGAGGGGGGGGGGTAQQLGGPQHPPLNDLISTVAGQVAPFVGGSHQLNASMGKGQGWGFQFMAGFTPPIRAPRGPCGDSAGRTTKYRP